ncbi:TetR/AcrR family transcriptional regulator C-terminal domain-containing protein [Streptomyces achromogenes]|uniref:TetR/AcrR family transcriptional regulator C-terminal domain-containing protein n=1 Tax=Streptomyces achromogenes TaxID=67255 RepID=UPI0036FCBA84
MPPHRPDVCARLGVVHTGEAGLGGPGADEDVADAGGGTVPLGERHAQQGRLQQSLAARLARLSLAGRLRACDPAEAAEQFLALLTGPMERRSRLGTHAVDKEEPRAVAGSGVGTFLLAYRPST